MYHTHTRHAHSLIRTQTTSITTQTHTRFNTHTNTHFNDAVHTHTHTTGLVLKRLEALESNLLTLVQEKETCDVEVVDEIEEDEPEQSAIGYYISIVFIFIVLSSFMYTVKDEIKICIAKLRSKSSKTTLSEMISYRTDYRFSTDPNTKTLVLLYSTSFLIIIGGIVFSVVSPENDFPAAIWESWQFIAGGDHFELETVSERVVGLLMTIAGMGVFGFMISIIEDTMQDYMDGLREGKSRVVERDHTLILGWADKAIPIIVEIALANESEGGGTVVILSERNKTELEEYILDKELDLQGTNIVVRSGSPNVGANLRKCSVCDAKSVILLASDGATAEDSDAAMIRTTLALLEEGVNENIVVEIQSKENARLINLLCKTIYSVSIGKTNTQPKMLEGNLELIICSPIEKGCADNVVTSLHKVCKSEKLR